MELARKLPFLAVVMALLTLSVGSLMISQGMVGAQTDPGVEEDDAGADSGGQIGLPPAAPIDTNPLNSGNTGAGSAAAAPRPPAAPIDGAGAGTANTDATNAAGLPQTGSGGYLDAGSANSSFYMLVSVVAMIGLTGSLVYARSRSK